MRYVAFDDEVFDTKEACEEYEERQKHLGRQMELVEDFIEETRADATERSNKMFRNAIKKWIVWLNNRQEIQDPSK